MSIDAVIRSGIGALPFSVGLNGRRPKLVLSLFDPACKRSLPTEIKTAFGPLAIDPAHGPQRMLAYAFANLLRHYRRSPLGRFIASHDPGPGETFLDIGANMGFYALLARQAGFKTALFEPEPRFSAFLQRNSAIFQRVFPMALSDVDGEELFFVSTQNPGASSLIDASADDIGTDNSVSVDVRTLATVCGRGDLDFSAVRLIKIDVEGAEAATLRGMGALFDDGHRPDIWCEARSPESRRQVGTYLDICRYMLKYGYRPFDCSQSLVPIDVAAFWPPTPVFDILFSADRPAVLA